MAMYSLIPGSAHHVVPGASSHEAHGIHKNAAGAVSYDTSTSMRTDLAVLVLLVNLLYGAQHVVSSFVHKESSTCSTTIHQDVFSTYAYSSSILAEVSKTHQSHSAH